MAVVSCIAHSVIPLLTVALGAQDGEPATHLGAYVTTISDLARPVAVAFGPECPGGPQLHVAIQGDGVQPPAIIVIEASAPGADGAADPQRVRTIGVGVLERPTGLAVDDRGDVFVTDEIQRTLWRFPVDGSEPTAFASSGWREGGLTLPRDVDVWSDGDARFAAVADEGSRNVLVIDLATGESRSFGATELVQPIAVCFLPGGDPGGRSLPHVAVCDGARHRIEIYAFDGTHLAGFGDWGSFPSLLSTPSRITFVDGRLFVADTENHRVQAFESKSIDGRVGRLAYRFGVHAIRPGEGAGALHYPSGLAIDDSATWLAVAEPLDDRVQIFGRAPGAEPVEDPTRASLGPPSPHIGPCISAAGQYIATVSPESHRVQIHDMRLGEPVKIAEVFGFGERLGMLRGPVGTWLGDHGRALLTLDNGNRRLTRSALRVQPDAPLAQDPELARHLAAVDLWNLVGPVPFVPGALTRLWTTDEAGRPMPKSMVIADRATDSALLIDNDFALVTWFRGNASTGPIRGIAGLAGTADGTLLVVDAAGAGTASNRGGRVLEFDAEGNVLRTFGEGYLLNPEGIATDGARVWVTDRARDRVEVFVRREDGTLEHERGFGERGLGRAQFHDPRGVAVLADGRIVVIDHGNHRGQIFDVEGNFQTGFGGRLYVKPLRKPR